MHIPRPWNHLCNHMGRPGESLRYFNRGAVTELGDAPLSRCMPRSQGVLWQSMIGLLAAPPKQQNQLENQHDRASEPKKSNRTFNEVFKLGQCKERQALFSRTGGIPTPECKRWRERRDFGNPSPQRHSNIMWENTKMLPVPFRG
jgi:hypothetical protein